jgi:hypothetical protein
MHVVEIFLPLNRRDGTPQPSGRIGELRRELVERFGGLTAFTRAPAEGLWEDDDNHVERDRIVIFEVMAEEIDRGWWSALRERLERDLDQEEVLIRASAIERL